MMRLLPMLLLLAACADDGCDNMTTRYNTRDLLTGEITSILCSESTCPNQPVNRTCRPG